MDPVRWLVLHFILYKVSDIIGYISGHGHSHGGPPARVESPPPISEVESDDEVEVLDAARATAGVDTEKSPLIGGGSKHLGATNCVPVAVLEKYSYVSTS